MANNRKITVDDMMSIAQDMAAKNDARFFKNADAKFSSVYKAGGNVTFVNFPVATDTTLGMVYNVTDAFTTPPISTKVREKIIRRIPMLLS